LGTYDDFILTAMSVQGNNTNFIDKAQRERKDLLAQFLDLELFEELHTIANDDSKSVSTLIKEFSKQDYSTKILSADAKRDEANTILLNLNSEKSEIEEKIEGLNSTVRDNENKLIQIDSNLSPNSLQTLLEKEISIKIVFWDTAKNSEIITKFNFFDKNYAILIKYLFLDKKILGKKNKIFIGGC
jgi:DNA repair exonuclease SbcCD ATPase subunit